MIYVNGELLNTRAVGSNVKNKDLVDEYHRTIKAAREKYGKHLIVETKQRPHPDEKTGHPIYPGTRGLLLRTTLRDDDDNVQEWVYSQQSLQKENDMLKLTDPTLLVQKGTYTIDMDRNPDLAFYVLKCKKVGLTEEEGKKFHVQDNEAKSKSNAAAKRIESKVAYLIYDGIPVDNLKVLAKSWGIGRVDSKHIDVVREELHKRVEDGERAKRSGSEGRGYDEFIESSAVKYNDQVSAMCLDAEEAGYLKYDSQKRRWVIDYQDKHEPYPLKDLSGQEVGDPLGSLVKYLLDDEKARMKVESVLNRPSLRPDDYEEVAPVTTNLPEDVTKEKIQSTNNVNVLKKWIKQIYPGRTLSKTMKVDEAKGILFTALSKQGE